MLLSLLACAPEAPTEAPPDPAMLDLAVSLVDPEPALELLESPPAVDLGAVDAFDDGDAAWVESTGAMAFDEGGALEFYLDGAVERFDDGDLTVVELAATLCGAGFADCAAPVRADLTWTLVDDDVLVSGVLVTPELGPARVAGNWRDGCPRPSEGVLLVTTAERHVLRFDEGCAECATWTIEGEEVGDWCD